MNWLTRFLPGGGGTPLTPDQKAALDAVAALPAPDLGRVHFETRYVAVNAETGPVEDGGRRLLAVGAVALNRGLIHPADAYYARLGDTPADALIGLLGFIARAPVVVFNAPFNRGSLERAFEQHLGPQPELAWIDLMVMLPSLYPERIGGQARMDAWLGSFGIDRYDSRDALLESLIVAQLHQVALAATRHFNLPTPRDLLDTESSRRWLRGG